MFLTTPQFVRPRPQPRLAPEHTHVGGSDCPIVQSIAELRHRGDGVWGLTVLAGRLEHGLVLIRVEPIADRRLDPEQLMPLVHLREERVGVIGSHNDHGARANASPSQLDHT